MWLVYPKSGAQGNVAHTKSEENDAPLSLPVKADERGINMQDKEHPSEGMSLQNGGNHLGSNGKLDKDSPV